MHICTISQLEYIYIYMCQLNIRIKSTMAKQSSDLVLQVGRIKCLDIQLGRWKQSITTFEWGGQLEKYIHSFDTHPDAFKEVHQYQPCNHYSRDLDIFELSVRRNVSSTGFDSFKAQLNSGNTVINTFILVILYYHSH
jgi:hypothetical protein